MSAALPQQTQGRELIRAVGSKLRGVHRGRLVERGTEHDVYTTRQSSMRVSLTRLRQVQFGAGVRHQVLRDGLTT